MNTSLPPSDSLITTAEAAAILGVSYQTIARLRASGALATAPVEGQRTGRNGAPTRVYFHRAEVLEHLRLINVKKDQ